MRLLPILFLGLLLAGCSSPPPAPDGDPAPAAPDAVQPIVIGEGTYQLGLPATGPVQASAGLGLVVPANETHLLVELTIQVGASVGLKAAGVPGCEHAYPDPQVLSEAPLVYECDTMPGTYTLEFTHQGGRLHFSVRVAASLPVPA